MPFEHSPAHACDRASGRDPPAVRENTRCTYCTQQSYLKSSNISSRMTLFFHLIITKILTLLHFQSHFVKLLQFLAEQIMEDKKLKTGFDILGFKSIKPHCIVGYGSAVHFGKCSTVSHLGVSRIQKCIQSTQIFQTQSLFHLSRDDDEDDSVQLCI